jgi:hypothetical protein
VRILIAAVVFSLSVVPGSALHLRQQLGPGARLAPLSLFCIANDPEHKQNELWMH